MTPRRAYAGPSWRTVLTRRWHQHGTAYHGAGSQAKRSPKDRSAIPGTVTIVSKVAVNGSGNVTPTHRPKRQPGSGQQDRGGIGANLGKPPG